jgi:hypothetical protein
MNTYRVYKNDILFGLFCFESIQQCQKRIKDINMYKKMLNFDTIEIANMQIVKIEYANSNKIVVDKFVIIEEV